MTEKHKPLKIDVGDLDIPVAISSIAADVRGEARLRWVFGESPGTAVMIITPPPKAIYWPENYIINNEFEEGQSIGVEVPPDGERRRISILGEVLSNNNGSLEVKIWGMIPYHRQRWEAFLTEKMYGET